MQLPEALLSDADGTLVNSVRLIRHGQYETSKSYLTAHGIPADEIPGYDDYELLLNQTVGTSARDTLEKTVRLLYENSPHHLDNIDFDALHDMLNPIQDKLAPEFVSAYDGLSPFLHRLGSLGVKLAIFTSGTPHHVVRNFGIALPELGMVDLYKNSAITDTEKLAMFEDKLKNFYQLPAFTVITCDDVPTHKPNPEGIVLAMKRLAVTPERSAVLGDHKFDIETGINANVPIRIGITHGFDDREVLMQAGATKVADALIEVTEYLEAGAA